MAEGFLPFHVPQQSRREKLRVTATATSTPHAFHFESPLPYHHHHFLHIDSLPTPPQSSTLSASTTSLNNHKKKQEEAAMIQPVHDTTPGNSSTTNSNNNAGLQLSLSNQSKRSSEFKCKQSSVMAMPVGPFTGYASILSRSRFLKPAQEILEDFCGFRRGGGGDDDRGGSLKSFAEAAAGFLDGESGSIDWSPERDFGVGGGGGNSDSSGLLSLLHQVYNRYKVYCEQMHSAVSSFETVAGLGNAAPFVCFAIKAVSKHFHCLKKAILDHINFKTKSVHWNADADAAASNRDNNNTTTSSMRPGFCSAVVDGRHHPDEKQLQNPGFFNHPVWRSQRGFPDKAVAVLKTWLFENFLHPYPTDSDKQMLANQTGLSRCQVSNWFTNARVRLWKPMVEEIHMLEKRSHLSSELQENQKFSNSFATHFTPPSLLPSDKDSRMVCVQNPRGGPPNKRSRTGYYLSQTVDQSREHTDMSSCNILPSHSQLIGGVAAGGESQTRRQFGHSGYVCSQDSDTGGLPWSADQQNGLPFWLGK